MKWVKDNDFVEIEHGASVDLDCAVWVVKSSLAFKDLPIEVRPQVPQADKERSKKLVDLVSAWAERNGFERVPA